MPLATTKKPACHMIDRSRSFKPIVSVCHIKCFNVRTEYLTSSDRFGAPFALTSQSHTPTVPRTVTIKVCLLFSDSWNTENALMWVLGGTTAAVVLPLNVISSLYTFFDASAAAETSRQVARSLNIKPSAEVHFNSRLTSPFKFFFTFVFKKSIARQLLHPVQKLRKGILLV